MELTRGASCAGFMVNAYELVINFPEELECIWMSGSYSVFQILYLFSRYGAFLAHIQNFLIAEKFQRLDPSIPPPPELYRWVLCKFLIWLGLISVIDAALSKQVYYLHNRRRSMFVFLLFIALCRLGLVSFVGIEAVKDLKTATPPTGRDTFPTALIVPYSVGEILLQCILLSLLLTKQGRTPIASKLAEGALELSAITLFLLIANIAYTLGSKAYVFIYPSFIAVMSSLACRLILSTQRACSRKREAPIELRSVNYDP